MTHVWTVTAASERDTAHAAACIAPFLAVGDLVCLDGPLGAGKSVFARAVIRACMGDDALEVPSPTFTLVQSYDTGMAVLHHFDLYRLAGPHELTELGWDDALSDGITLVEWPERAGDALPGDRLDIRIDQGEGGTDRVLTMTGHGIWAARLARAHDAAAFLDNAGWGNAGRRHLHGDASYRTYEKLVLEDGRKAVLMNAPQRPDGPPIRDGRPYSAIAHLAENVRPFIAIAQGLRAAGFSAPEIYAADAEAGLLLLEDLGGETIVEGAPPVPVRERYACAVDVLAAMRRHRWPSSVTLDDGFVHELSAYDREAMEIEAELVLDWFAPFVTRTIRGRARTDFAVAWQNLFPLLGQGPHIWVLRDYHSPNILWLSERDGLRRAGLLDFQDAVTGHPAYDLVSLLQDARLDVAETLEAELLERYLTNVAAREPEFDRQAFRTAYALLGAQRNTKILGIFARLAKRDGKPGYLRHMPRIAGYLARNIAHPALASIAQWYGEYLPEALDRQRLRGAV